MSKAKIDLEQLIDALIEGKKALAALTAAEQGLQNAAQQKASFVAQIDILQRDFLRLDGEFKSQSASLNEQLARQRESADADMTAYRAAKEAEKQKIEQSIAEAKSASESTIASYQAQESAAKQATAAAKAELATINDALDKSRNELSKAAKYANMARA